MVTSGSDFRRRVAGLAIESFCKQTYQPRELLILNYGERIGISGVGVREESVDFPGSLGALRNMVFERAEGEYVAIWDDDDYYRSDRLAWQMGRIGKAEACVLGRIINCRLDTGESRVMDFHPFPQGGCAASVLFRRDTLHRYGDLNVSEDNVFMESLRLAGELKAWDNDPLMYVRMLHADTTTVRPMFGQSKLTEEQKAYVQAIRLEYLKVLA
jgi:glycosyltransferase involved in cell wall biosynthesis